MINCRHSRNAFTIIEILVALVILTTIILMLMPVFTYSRKTVDTMNRLDVYHDTRKISHEINGTLKLATEVIFPDTSSKHSWRGCIIFRNPMNQVLIFYLNDRKDLVVINYDRIRNGKVVRGKTIAGNVENFQVRRKESNLIEYRVKLSAQGSKDLEFTGMINLANLI